MIVSLAIHQLMANVFRLFLLSVTLAVQEIREKDHLDDDEEDKQLDADNQPQRLAHGHAAESIIIQMENTRPKPLFIMIRLFTHRAEKALTVKNAKLTIIILFPNIIAFIFGFL